MYLRKYCPENKYNMMPLQRQKSPPAPTFNLNEEQRKLKKSLCLSELVKLFDTIIVQKKKIYLTPFKYYSDFSQNIISAASCIN